MKASAQSHILVAGKCQDLQPGRCGSGMGAQHLRPRQAIGCRLQAPPCQSTWPGPLSQENGALLFSGKDVVPKGGFCLSDPGCPYTVILHHYALLGGPAHPLAEAFPQ